MEDNLATLSRRELEGLLRDDGRSLQTSLTGQYKAFDGTIPPVRLADDHKREKMEKMQRVAANALCCNF